MIQTCWGWASLTGHRLSQEGSQGSTMVMYIPQNDRNPIELFEFYYEKTWTFSPSIREIYVGGEFDLNSIFTCLKLGLYSPHVRGW